MKRILFLMAAFACIQMGMACTNFLVGKGASTDGSVFITYNADSYGMYGRLIYLPHAKHQPGEMREIYDGDTNHYYGKIPEASETYAVMGYINEYQLSIMETTFGGREELVDPEGKIDYVSLMRLGLQRAKTAREAIKVMTDLVAEYGYDYLNLERDVAMTGIEDDKDFYNLDHLNIYGQKKFTEYLTDHLISNYGVTARELSDSQKSDWHLCGEYYNAYYKYSESLINKGDRRELSEDNELIDTLKDYLYV